VLLLLRLMLVLELALDVVVVERVLVLVDEVIQHVV